MPLMVGLPPGAGVVDDTQRRRGVDDACGAVRFLMCALWWWRPSKNRSYATTQAPRIWSNTNTNESCSWLFTRTGTLVFCFADVIKNVFAVQNAQKQSRGAPGSPLQSEALT